MYICFVHTSNTFKHAYILVYNDNNPPLAIDDINDTYVNEDASGNVGTNDIEPEGDPVTYTLISGSLSDGSLVFNPDGTYTFTPPTDEIGTYTFEYSLFKRRIVIYRIR